MVLYESISRFVSPHILLNLPNQTSHAVVTFTDSLNLLYNVNFSLVSQVNPHVHLFAFSPRGAPGRPVAHRSGKGWRGGFLLSAAEQYLKIELMKNFRVSHQDSLDQLVR